ncbi:MAG: site-specific integrase [Alphaproteobacteria bacterium]|nr:site-specific integrase [Alphaproteobacteria bacterium]
MQPGEIVHDKALKGFGARRQKDSVSYFLKTRIDGRQRWITIGRHGAPWTPDTARKQAMRVLADPSHAQLKSSSPKLTTFADVAASFMTLHGPKLKRSTRVVYESLLKVYLLPTFGTTNIKTITRADVSSAHAKWGENPRSANHALAVLSKIMSWAEDQGYRSEDSNPCRRIQRYKEQKRQTYLTTDELSRLGAALDKADAECLTTPYAIAAIRLLVLTGARLSEILTLEWAHVDTERQIAFLPDSKTGAKPILLNDAALAVINTLPRIHGNPYIIIGKRDGAHLVNLTKPWHVVRNLAGLDHVRIHDLRHTFASHAVSAGASLPVIGRALGHSQPQTTARYAHLADDPVRQLTQSTGASLAQAMKRQSP